MARIAYLSGLGITDFQQNFSHGLRYPVVFGERKFFEVFVDEEVVGDAGSFA